MADNFQFTLAKTYLDGNDEEKALDGLEMMKKLAENGNADAAFEVGLVYSEGCLVINDQEEAKKWYRLGAKLGSGAARAKLDAIERGDDPRAVVVPAGVNGDANQTPQEDGPRFKCGKCGQIVQMKIARQINATGNAELKNRVVTGQFFNQVCPRCGTAGIVPYPCVYVDNNASLFVDVCSDRQTALNDEDTKSGMDDGGWDEQWSMQGRHNVRVAVADLNALREIILIVDAGLDPYALAMCKKIVRDEQGIKARDHILFMASDAQKNTIGFWYVDAATKEPKNFTIPRQSYENVLKILRDSDFEPLRMCEIVDEDSIDELLGRTASLDPEPTAEFWQKKEAAKGHAPTDVFNLGVAYYYGEGVRQNRYKAFKCFREAAEAKDPDAQYALSVCYARGYGATPSQFRSEAWLKSAAEGGCADAQYQMGRRCENGEGVEKDIKAAYAWYEKAFHQNHGPATKAIGRIYEFGLLDGEKDAGTASEWYQMAVSFGEESAKEDQQRALAKYNQEHRENDDSTPPEKNAGDNPVPPNDKPPIDDVQRVARDLIQQTVEAFQNYLRQIGICHNDIEARGEFGFAESIIHFFENDPQIKGHLENADDVDELRQYVFRSCWSAGLIYGGKFMTAPDQLANPTLRQILAEREPFAFSSKIKTGYYHIDEIRERVILGNLYRKWVEVFAPFEGRKGSEQLVGCLYYVGLHLGVTMMLDRRCVQEGSTFDFCGLDELLTQPQKKNDSTENSTPPNGHGPFPFKVGKMVQKVFPVLFSEGKVNDADIDFLLSEAAAKRFKTGGCLVLKRSFGDPENDAKDANGRKRYYTKFVLPFGPREFLLTSQWFDKSLDPVLEWLNEHGIDRTRAGQICVAAGLTPIGADDEGDDNAPPPSTPPSQSSVNSECKETTPPAPGKLVVECGVCHEKFEPTLQELFDLDKSPDLVKRACDLSLFAQLCPHCHGMTNVPYPTTVIQASKRYMIRLSFDRNEVLAISRAKRNFLEGSPHEGMRQRVVLGVPSFIEKIRIFNQGLDDNLIEAMKLLFLGQNEGREIANMLFAGISNGQFRFLVLFKGQGEPTQAGMPGEVYDKLQEETAGKFPEGYMRYVSHVTVGKLLNGETEDDKIDPLKVLDVFAACGGKFGLLKQRNFNIGPWKGPATQIASMVQEAVKTDEELHGDFNMMRDIGVFAALHIGLGASVEWVANSTGFNPKTVFDSMMLEGGFCRVGEIPFEKLASFTNEDFETTFRKYSDALEAIAKDIAIKTHRFIDPNAEEKPSGEMLEGYWELLHKEFFCAFLCGMNAGLLLQNEGAQLDVKGGVAVQIDYGKHINLALAQNKCPLITSLKIKNLTEEKMEGLVCRLSSTDDFFQTKSVEVGPLWPGAETELGSMKLIYNVGFLRKLEDAQQGSFRVEVVSGDETLFSKDYEVQALAADQSHDIWALPIFIASFVKPNCEAIHQLQSDVAREMQKIASGDASLAGYQLDREHVFKMCAAMYRAIQKKGVSYSNPASSFNLPGQKIRMPDTVFKYKVATCLDSTILFASIMEACLLHPVIIMISGHAFVGCFLAESHLPQVELRDPQVLRKLIAANEFIAIETTMVTSDSTFEEAERTGREVRLAAERDGDFYCAVDVVSARQSGVMPLALGNAAEDSEFVAEGHEVDQNGVGKLRRIVSVDITKLKKAEAPTGRVAVWAQKLLDLSPTNKLLNAKEGKDVLRISCPDVGKLEDWLASNYELPVRSVVDAFSTNDVAELKKNKGRISTDRIRQIIEAEFSCQRICVDDTPRAVQRSLKALYKLGKQDLEETGAHTLFVAIGFVQWRDPKKRKNAAAYEAPIILVPIRIGQQRTDAGICISRRDDETVVNTTLLQFLRAQYQIEVPGLDPLPMDDAGLDVPHILQIFRECLKRAVDLEVVDGAAIGHFSFGKFAMWRDLMEHHDILEKNPLVNHLINAGGRYNDGIDVFDRTEIAAHLKPDELYCPVSADSSQLTAVLYSQLGKSFVLYGPPGTGKSQTITNMVAHNLALGRRVLFVSEKKAALDVVHKRLKEVGLEPFCLELHSNKGDKGSVMAQFESSLAVTRDKSADEWLQSAQQIADVRDELAGYVNALHHVYPNRLSAYDCFSHALLKGEPKYQELITADTLTQTWEQKEEQKNALKSLIVEIRNTTPEALKAIPRLKEASWSIHYERDLKVAAEKLRDASRGLSAAYKDVASQFSLPDNPDNSAVGRSVELLKVVKAENKSLSNLGSDGITPERLKEMLEEAERREAIRAEAVAKQAEVRESLIGWDIDKLMILDIKSVRARIEEVAQAGFLTRHFKENSFLKEFAELKKSLGKLTMTELTDVLVKTEKLRAANKEVERVIAENAKAAATQQANNAGSETSALEDELVKKIDAVLAAWERYLSARTEFSTFADEAVIGNDPDTTAKVCAELVDNIGKIRGVFRYRPFRNTADQLGVSEFADKFEKGEIQGSDLLRMFDEAYLGKMLFQVEEANPILPGFFGRSHETKIEEFQKLIDRYSNLSQQAIFAQIASRYPDFGGSSFSREENRQLGVLQREMHKKKGQTSVRALLADVGDLVKRYKPCFLMSPLSVAQFLEMDVDPFDLIIFDEASQIEVCDAIGVMARGKQVIVVGDPQQMPPTNFFGGAVSVEALKAVDDAESILVECLDVGLPKTYLNWHYRSRHESLIAFSNHNYYEDELFSFPSVSESERLGVKFHLVKNGVYGHGTNPIEAKAVVDYVCSRVKSERYRKHPRSIGIVTFNMQQQGVIEEMIERRCECDVELKDILLGNESSDGNGSANGDEKVQKKSDEKMFFVRNLENVQGDEADVIIFSITFGPDEKGKVSMNFGPLNREGGERRLNVAVTRAREQMVVFSSMRYTRIETDADSALGARGLRDFLEYAQSGSRSSSCKAAVKRDAGFGNVVADFLEKHGYNVVRNVGYSGYKIDMAVLNPYNPKEYLLGIECDGPSYAQQLTVRDRDVLRSSVLARGGWKMCRVWCAEWYHDREGAEARLLELLESIKPVEPAALENTVEDDVPEEIFVEPPVVDEPEKDEDLFKKDAKSDEHKDKETPPKAERPPEQPPVEPPVVPTKPEQPKVPPVASPEPDTPPVKPPEPPHVPPVPPKEDIPPVVPPTPVEPPVPPVVPSKPTPADSPTVTPTVQPPAENVYPLTEAALVNIRYPIALQFDGQDVRVVASWQDCYLALCEKLNDIDAEKFGALPDIAMFKRFFLRLIQRKKYADCYPAKFGANGDVKAKIIGSKSYFYMPNYVVYNLLKHYGIDPQTVTIRA